MNKMVIRPDTLKSLNGCLEHPGHVIQEHKLRYLLRTIVEEFTHVPHGGPSEFTGLQRNIGVRTIANELAYLKNETDLNFDRNYQVDYLPELGIGVERVPEIQGFLYNVVKIFGEQSEKVKHSPLLKPEAHIEGLISIVSALNKLQTSEDEPLIFADQYRVLFSYY